MKLRRLLSLLLSVLMIASIASVAIVNTAAADTTTAETGARLGNYYNVDYLEDKAYNGTDLGANYTPSKTTWKVWSPNATRIQLKLFTTGSDMESGAAVIGKYDMTFDSKTSVWSIALDGDWANKYYTYIITTPAGTNETYDIYAKAAGVNGNRSMVVDLAATNPDGWDKDEHVFQDNQTDEAIWEVHIADMTSSDNSGVDKNYQGKYLGFAEGGLTINGKDGAKSVGIDYLVEQGIKAVHIQCPFDFASGDETNAESYNWGYDPKNYNVPEGLYATNPYDGNVRINEFKQLIQALHDRDITVIMGVVYNHTYVTEQSAFTYTVPGYYYRMSSATFYINGTGCGNTLASDKAMFRNYMMQSLKFWVEEYHIDGFRFDLMAAHDTTTMNMIRDMFNGMYGGEGKKIIMYGEPWTAGSSSGLDGVNECSTSNLAKLNSNIAGFNSNTRQALHGSESGTMKGWVQGAPTAAYAGTLKSGATGTFQGAKYPNQSINYADCHDGVTMWDNILMAQKAASTTNTAGFDTTNATYRSQLRTFFAYLYTAQGVPFTLAGTEFARSKYGNGNSYNLGDVNAFDWERIETYSTEVAYAKGLREIRRAFTPFRESTSRNSISWLSTSSTNGILAYTLNNTKAGEWSKIVVAVNNGSAGTVTLPAGEWTIIANGEKAGLVSLGTASGTYSIGANSSAILVQGTTTAKTAEFETVTVNHYAGGKLLKTTEALYEVGTTWRATPDAYTIFDHNIEKIEATTGTKDGDTYFGTVTKGQNVVVDFYYTQFNTSGYLTIKYVDESGEDVVSPVTYRMLDETEFNVPFENKAGFELVSEKYPTNFKGIFDAENPTTITFVYRALASDKITVYYYNALGNGTLRMYAYTEEELKPLGAWDNSLQNMEKVTNVAELPAGETVGNWYKKTIDKTNNQLDFFPASCKVMFLLSGQGKQEPLNGEAGYDASGTIFVKNKIVTFDSKVITSHIDANTGKKLADDQVVEYNNVTSNEIYVTNPKAGLGKSFAPSNASANLVAGSICVVYMYDTTQNDDIGGGDEGGIILGDADLDGKVNVKDATVVQKSAADLVVLNADALLAADADKDGKVNVKDATVIQKYSADIEVSTPVGEVIPGTGTASGLKDELIALYNTASELLKDNADYVVEAALKANDKDLAKKADFGFDLSKEDTSKNEYQKFEAVLNSAGYFVVQGGTDEELQNAIDELEKATEWFEYFVTEVHPEPVTTAAGARVVYFTNNKYWNTVCAYAWSTSNNQNNAGWPGVNMTFVTKNDNGEDVYKYEVPEGMNMIIFNNGNQGQQTVDLSLDTYTQNAFYISGGSGSSMTVGQWDYVG